MNINPSWEFFSKKEIQFLLNYSSFVRDKPKNFQLNALGGT